jgi:hypothetical protein
MNGARFPRLAAWLGLVAALILGLLPGEGMVLCFEPDGTVALELSDSGLPCDDGGTREVSLGSRAPASSCCACLDLPIGVSSAARVRPASVALHAGAPGWIAPVLLRVALATRVELRTASLGRPPAPPGTLTRLRTVELRV